MWRRATATPLSTLLLAALVHVQVITLDRVSSVGTRLWSQAETRLYFLPSGNDGVLRG